MQCELPKIHHFPVKFQWNTQKDRKKKFLDYLIIWLSQIYWINICKKGNIAYPCMKFQRKITRIDEDFFEERDCSRLQDLQVVYFLSGRIVR